MNVQEFLKNVVAKIRSRSRDQWAVLCLDGLTELRIWIQEHGEKAAILAFALGLLIALAFKLFVGILVIGVLAGYLVWYLAPPSDANSSAAKSSGVAGDGKSDTATRQETQGSSTDSNSHV